MGDDNKENAIYTIEHLLGRIRTSGTKNIEPVKTLIGLLLEKDPKEIYLTKEECLLLVLVKKSVGSNFLLERKHLF